MASIRPAEPCRDCFVIRPAESALYWQCLGMRAEALIAEFDLNTAELFDRVLAGLRTNEDSALRSLIALQNRPTHEVTDRCLTLCASTSAEDRVVGLRVLRELRHVTVGSEELWSPIEPVIIELAAADPESEVARWAIACLGYQSSSSAARACVLGRADDADVGIRLAVANHLPSLLSDNDEAGLGALIGLTDDSDADVRSYALMGLTVDLDLGEEVRPVLEAHLSDADEQIRRHVGSVLKALETDSE